MKKFKMPTVKEFLEKKTIYGEKKDPVWVYLEKEMKENLPIKPYNEKVGAWLQFLKEFKYFQYREGKRKYKKLNSDVGPPWYYELSYLQRETLDSLRANIHQDLIENLPARTRKALLDLGITLKVPKSMLLQAMKGSAEDPGIFIWNLFTNYYKRPPSYLRAEYDINAMILMSSLVFIDLNECIEKLEKLTASKTEPASVKPTKQRKNLQPKVKYGEYLQRMYVPEYNKYSTHESMLKKKPLPLGNKLKLRSESSYEKLRQDNNFLEKRKERNQKQQIVERVCTYKFWEPPCTLRNNDPKLVAYLNKLKMLLKKAKPKFSSPYANVQYNVGGVAFAGGKPHFILNTVSLLPTGYIPINGGIVSYGNENLIHIHGFWKFPKEENDRCSDTCDCIAKWRDSVMEYIKNSKCKCGHRFDYYHTGKATEKYFYQATKYNSFWMDYAKVFQMDPVEDFIKDTFRDAILSSEPTENHSALTLMPGGIKEEELIASFLAELSDTPLLIPHLPKANHLNILLEWVRKRVKGKMSSSKERKLLLQSQRRWLDLKHMDFRARAYRIPFTQKQLANMKWSHRQLVQKLFNILLNDFVSRNRLKQLEQTRLWWSTMKNDVYPSKAFADIFFTYMPGRMKDTFLVNPYSIELIQTHGAKTCPLQF